MRIISFDIFNTLLYRLCERPENVFELMKKHFCADPAFSFLPQEFRKDFPKLRSFSAVKAREMKHNEATFTEIYRYIAEKNGIEFEKLKILQHLEFEIEKKVLCPIPENIELIHEFLDRGQKVILLSDMYYSANQLRELLKNASERIAGECDVIVSSEYDKTKRSGELFQKVFELYSISPGELAHYGDDLVADLEVPRRLGVSCILLKPPVLPVWEKTLSRSDSASIALISGITANLKYENSLEHIGAAFAGPILYSYVYWILTNAGSHGIKHLYFMSRDGYILMRIAEKLQPALAPGLKMHYLYVSRRAVMTATYFELDDNRCWDFIILNHPDVTVREMADRLLLSTEELLNACRAQGRNYSADDTIDFDNAGWIRWCVTVQPEIKTLIECRSAEARKNLLDYFRKSHVFDSAAGVGLVDVGWKGTIQDSIYFLLQRVNPETQLTGYYFGLSIYTNHHIQANRKFGYAFYPYTQTPFCHSVLRFIEVFCFANTGMTLSYLPHGIPQLATDYARANEKSVEAMQRGILKFVDEVMTKNLRHECFLDQDYTIILNYMENPDGTLAESLGDYLYFLGTNDARCSPLAPAEGVLQMIKRQCDRRKPLWVGGYNMRLSRVAWLMLFVFKKCRTIALKIMK